MSVIEKLRNIAILCAAVFAFAACSDEEDVTTNAELSLEVVSGQDENCAVVLTARQGMSYTATIISEDDWCKWGNFSDTIDGEMPAEHTKSQFLYFSKNFTATDRIATIVVDFADGNSFRLQLTQKWADATIAFERAWAELPECKVNEDYYYRSYFDNIGGKSNVRNYSICFDRTKKAALWVAYPLHRFYTNGSASRSDDFIPEPTVPTQYQPALYKSYSGRYDRGHQIAAADRKCSQKMMDDTFYWTNMTPQQSDFNQKLWGSLEGKVRGVQCADTLYVVTGAYFDGERDSSIQTTTTAGGVSCPIPTHYYKLLLRTEKGNTNKSISEITNAGDLRAVAIFIPHHNSGNNNALQSDWFISVNELERITGFDFFPMLDDAIEEQVEGQCDRSKWF